jgi:hypothetical protein
MDRCAEEIAERVIAEVRDGECRDALYRIDALVEDVLYGVDDCVAVLRDSGNALAIYDEPDCRTRLLRCASWEEVTKQFAYYALTADVLAVLCERGFDPSRPEDWFPVEEA